MLCGARSLYAAAQWGRDYGDEIVIQLGFKAGKTPCCATLHNVLKKLDIDAFESTRKLWGISLGGLDKGTCLAIDGKVTVRFSRP